MSMLTAARVLSIIPDDEGRFDIYLQVGGRSEYLGPVDVLDMRIKVKRHRVGLPRVFHVRRVETSPLLFPKRRPR